MKNLYTVYVSVAGVCVPLLSAPYEVCVSHIEAGLDSIRANPATRNFVLYSYDNRYNAFWYDCEEDLELYRSYSIVPFREVVS